MRKAAVLFLVTVFLLSGCVTGEGEAHLVFSDELYEIVLYPQNYSMQLSYSCKVKNDGSAIADRVEFSVNPLLKVVEANRDYESEVYEYEYYGFKVLGRALSVNLSLKQGEESELKLLLSGHPIEKFGQKPLIRMGVSEVYLSDLLADGRPGDENAYWSQRQHTNQKLYLFVPENMRSIISPVFAEWAGEFEGNKEAPEGYSVYNYTIRSGLFRAYVGDFIETAEKRNNITVRTYLPREIRELAPIVQDTAHKALDFYSTTFYPYPYEEYTIIAKDYESRGGGGGKNYAELSGGVGDFYLLVHEIAHAWFGGIIGVIDVESTPEGTIDFPENEWIDEGGATYCELLISRELGREDFEERFESVMQMGAKGNATENPYYRGAMVYWYLQSTMGEKAFFSFMREFFERYAGQNVTTSDFLSFARDHGIDVGKIEDLLYEDSPG